MSLNTQTRIHFHQELCICRNHQANHLPIYPHSGHRLLKFVYLCHLISFTRKYPLKLHRLYEAHLYQTFVLLRHINHHMNFLKQRYRFLFIIFLFQVIHCNGIHLSILFSSIHQVNRP